jgi:hypothetical protein
VRERGAEVEVGDGDVRVAGHDGGPVGLQRTEGVDDGARVRAVEHEVPGDQDLVRPLGLDRGQRGLERRQVAVDVGQDRDPRHPRFTIGRCEGGAAQGGAEHVSERTSACVSERAQATRPRCAVIAGPRPEG